MVLKEKKIATENRRWQRSAIYKYISIVYGCRVGIIYIYIYYTRRPVQIFESRIFYERGDGRRHFIAKDAFSHWYMCIACICTFFDIYIYVYYSSLLKAFRCCSSSGVPSYIIHYIYVIPLRHYESTLLYTVYT